MSRYDRFKALTSINEEYILESMPDHFNTRAAKRHAVNPVVRFFGSGWGVACICAVVALTVTAFVIRAGQDPWTPPAGQVEESGESTEAVTQAPEPKEYQGMTADVPYQLSYYSYGDGTCIVNGITANILYKGEYTVEIPETSPDGDTVIGIEIHPTYNIPAYVTEADFEKIKTALLAYYENDDNFYYKRFMSYFQLKGLEFLGDSPDADEEKAKLLTAHPICQVTNIYVFDRTATGIEFARRSLDIKNAFPEYTAKHCYADLLKLKKIADKHGITDPNLEEALADHSDNLGNAVTIKLPKTLRSDHFYDEIPVALSIMGVQSLTFDGTMEEYLVISDVKSTEVYTPLTVHCSDGDFIYPIRKPEE
ncbi:MAG: hypothetical protein IJW90_09280 [Clostridia bacterium]|nr:hypothetical protein [Clostridia bacterium]